MLATFDLNAVRRFTEELKEQQRRCENGEGMFCSSLDEAIDCHAKLCDELLIAIRVWARAVFTGQAAYDPEVETVLRAQVRDLLPPAKRVAARGREKNWECFELKGLNALHYQIMELDYLQEQWVVPQRAFGPAPRVTIPDEAKRQIAENLEKLPPLPYDWYPSDPEQIARYQQQITE